MIVRVPALAGIGACELKDIPAPCDPWKTQEYGCVCADAQGNLLNQAGGIVDIYGSRTPGFSWPDLDAKTIGLAVGVIVVLLAVRR